MESIEVLWSKLTPGAIIVLDDYAFTGYETPHRAWDDFAKSCNLMILTVPTGQGLLINTSFFHIKIGPKRPLTGRLCGRCMLSRHIGNSRKPPT
jgi:hypothetical protein